MKTFKRRVGMGGVKKVDIKDRDDCQFNEVI